MPILRFHCTILPIGLNPSIHQSKGIVLGIQLEKTIHYNDGLLPREDFILVGMYVVL
jgi:hypothetical protein